MTLWIRAGLRFAAVLCTIVATSGIARAQDPLVQSQPADLGTMSIGQVEMALSATGGTGTYVWSVIGGALPPGIALRADTPSHFPAGASGLIGVATTVGTYNFTLRVTSGAQTVDQASTLRITLLRVKDIQQLPDAFVGTFYTYTLTALDNAGTVTWTPTEPAFPVPPGMTLSAGGVLSGTPTTASNYYRTGFSITDGTDTVYLGLSLRVSAIEITTPGVLPNTTQNASYSTAVAAAGGAGTFTFSANGLPNGLSINSAGGISGTVNTSAGKFSVNVTATDTNSASYTKTMSIDVVGAPPLLPNINPYGNAFDDCTIGAPCSRGVGVYSGGTAPFAWSASGLPAGMSIRTADGVTSSWITPGDAELWGAPNSTGTFSVQLTVTDATGATATNTFPLHVSELSQPQGLSNGTINVAYSQTPRVIGGQLPYAAAQTGGLLPAGLALNGGTLLVSGTPTESGGGFSPVLLYTDANSQAQTLRVTSNLFISGGASTISINTNADLGSMTLGSYSRQFSACCVGSYDWSVIGGTLPPGLTLSSGGFLSGTLTTAGLYTFTVKAADAGNAANFGARQFTLNVTTISINGSSTLTTGNVGTPFTNTFTASGGTGTLTWALAPSSYLPPGLTLASNGTLSGNPTASGQFFFTVSVADTASHTAARQFSVSFYPAGTPPPVFQSQGSNFGTFSIGQVETSLSATGGTGSYTWSVVGGALPPGLAVRTDKPSFFPASASAGLIGVATTPGLYTFTLRVTSGGVTADQASTLRITALVNKESQLPEAFVGVPYSYALSALGNAGSVTWTASGGLPAGLSLSAAGVISGTPTTANSFANISFSLTDGVHTVFKSVNLSIYAVRITSPGVLPNATQNSPYSTTIAAAGGAGGYTFSTNGLPNGLSINSSSGVISGTVNSNGSSLGKFTVNVTARDSSFVSYTKTMSIDVVGASPTLPSVAPPNSSIYDCTLGVWCTRTIAVQNGGTAPFSWSATGLPPGTSIRSGSGTTSSFVSPGDVELWGVPTALGTYNVQLTVTDALGATATNTFPMRVSPLLQTTFLQSGAIDTAYSQTLRVLGGTGPYTVVQSAGQLAAGLSINEATLLLSGVPTESGNFNPAFTYSDSASHTLLLDSSFFINGAGSGLSIGTNSSSLNPITTGSFYSNQFSACCGGSIGWSVIGGSLPPGLTLSSDGLLSGTASTSGTYTFLLKATGSPATNYAARQFTLNVTPLSIQASSPLPFGNVATPYTQTLTATGGTGALTWTVAAGSYLGPGLTLASNGVLSGTPTGSGQYVFTITVTDTASHTRSTTLRVSIYPAGINPPPTISTNTNFGTFSIGQVETSLSATGGTGTYTWSVVGGALPPGLAVRTDKPSFFPASASAGLIGVATTPGLYTFTLRVTSGGVTADQASTLRITALVNKESQLPEAFVGVPYSYALSALGNAGSVSWTASGGLPAGLSLSAAGVISGTPTTANSFANISFSLTDGVHTVFKSVNLSIYAVRITSPGVLPNATQNSPYSTTIAAAGGAGGYTFSTNGLPNGLSINSSSGVISGTVNSNGSSLGKFTVNVTARDSSFVSYTKTMSIDVVGATPTTPVLAPLSSPIYDCTVGVSCTRPISVQSGGTAPFSWSATGLPPGMSIRSGSGTTLSWVTPGDAELWGVATATGTYNVELQVTDALGATDTETFPMSVSSLLQTTFLPGGTVGTAYSQTQRVLGGTGTYTAAQSAGQLPAGLSINGTTLVVSGIPTASGNFRPVFTYTDSAGHTLQIDNSLFVNAVAPTMTYPPNGATNADTSQPVQWTAVLNAQAYYLYIGSTVGAKDLVNTGEIQQTSRLVSLPGGQTVYARIFAKVGNVWRYTDSSFTTASFTPSLTYPPNGATNADMSQPVQWTTVLNAQAYYLYVGSTVGAQDLVNTGEIQQTSRLVSLPGGQTVYARIFAKVGNVWRYTDSSFTTASFTPSLTYPPNGATNADMSQPVQWTTVLNAQAYYLYVGSTVGAQDLVNTGEIQQTSRLVSLPGGQTVYARIWAKVGNVWRYTDSSFTTASFTPSLTSPANGATSADMSQPVQWTAVLNAQAYYLYIGSTVGAKDLVNTGEIQQTSRLVSLPGGQTVYARIFAKVGNVWRYTDSSFTTASFTPSLTSPANGATNADMTQPVQWTTVLNAQAYYLYIGSTVGAKDLVNTGEIQQTSRLVSLPGGQTVYARIWAKVGNVWRYTDSTFTTQ